MVEQDIPDHLLGWARKANHVGNKPYCVNCEGDVGECRWSWPMSDTKRGNSDQAAWRCKPTYFYGQACNNNVMFCEDWCTRTDAGEVYACNWSWPLVDPKAHKSDDGACRCDYSKQEFKFTGKEVNKMWGVCDGCTGENEVCRNSFPVGISAEDKRAFKV